MKEAELGQVNKPSQLYLVPPALKVMLHLGEDLLWHKDSESRWNTG